ncbi:hypothetical protein BGZ63DRAFT_403704 [Mariannaea sp. PMI_226]|nr:hypothetical protein BGZ63DRAFT_403704 [Mariannaea sp. PMI_226]
MKLNNRGKKPWPPAICPTDLMTSTQPFQALSGNREKALNRVGGDLNNSKKHFDTKAGTEDTRKSAAEIQKQKAEGKQHDIIRFWAQTFAQFKKDPNLVSRYMKVTKSLWTRSKNHN